MVDYIVELLEYQIKEKEISLGDTFKKCTEEQSLARSFKKFDVDEMSQYID